MSLDHIVICHSCDFERRFHEKTSADGAQYEHEQTEHFGLHTCRAYQGSTEGTRKHPRMAWQ